MKVTAYICDCCGRLMDEKEATALIIVQPDLFNSAIKYETNANPDKSNLHFSIHCYRKHVLDLLGNINRQTNDEDYNYYYKIYSTNFYERIYRKAHLRNSIGNRR